MAVLIDYLSEKKLCFSIRKSINRSMTFILT